MYFIDALSLHAISYLYLVRKHSMKMAKASRCRPLAAGHTRAWRLGPGGPPEHRPIFSFLSGLIRYSRGWSSGSRRCRDIPPSLCAGTAPDVGAGKLLLQVLHRARLVAHLLLLNLQDSYVLHSGSWKCRNERCRLLVLKAESISHSRVGAGFLL